MRQLCRSYYSDEQIDGWLNPRKPEHYFPAIDRGIYFLAMVGPEIVGFGGALPGEVWAVYVLPERTGKGIGTTILNHAIEIARSGAQKIVLDSTLNAVGFYRKRGFVEGERKLIRRGDVELFCVQMEYFMPCKKLQSV